MKSISQSVIVLLSFSLCVQICLPLPALSQSRNDRRLKLSFSIFGAEKVCAGEPIILEARLTNDGDRSIRTNVASIWKNFAEIAYDRSSTGSKIEGIPLQIPQMRRTSADIGFQIGARSTFLTIGKGETYSSFLVLNRNSDDFYKLPGKYAVRSLFSPDNAPGSGQKPDASSKSIEAKDHVFQIVRCE